MDDDPDQIRLDRAIAEQLRDRLGRLEIKVLEMKDVSAQEMVEYRALRGIHDAAWRVYDPELHDAAWRVYDPELFDH